MMFLLIGQARRLSGALINTHDYNIQKQVEKRKTFSCGNSAMIQET